MVDTETKQNYSLLHLLARTTPLKLLKPDWDNSNSRKWAKPVVEMVKTIDFGNNLVTKWIYFKVYQFLHIATK